MYAGVATPLTHIPPQVPPHGRLMTQNQQSGGTPRSRRSRDSYCEEVRVVNVNMNQCATNPKTPNRKPVGDCHQCEREPLLNSVSPPAPLNAHVLPLRSNLTQNHISAKSMTPSRAMMQQMKPHHGSSPPRMSNHNRPYMPKPTEEFFRNSDEVPSWACTDLHGTKFLPGSMGRKVCGRNRDSSHQDRNKNEGDSRNRLFDDRNHLGPGLILPPLPRHYRVEEAGVRHKLRNFTRHYSDDSLHGSSHKDLHSTRIHSSADEISSINRSPSISSSDESFSRTDFSRTDADSPSPQHALSLSDERFKYMFDGMNLPGAVAPGFRELSPQIYSDYLSSVKASSDDGSLRLNSLTDENCYSYATIPGLWRESDITRPPPESEVTRRDDLVIPKLTAEFLSDKVKRAKTNDKNDTEVPALLDNLVSHNTSSVNEKIRPGCRLSYVEGDLNSPSRTSASGSTSRLRSLEKSPRESAVITPDSVVLVPKKRSSSREEPVRSNGHALHESESRKRPSVERAKKDGECQTDPRVHHKRTSGEKDKSRKIERSATFEGIPEDQVSRRTAGSRYSNNSSNSEDVENRIGNNISDFEEFSDHGNPLAEETLDGYDAVREMARLQENALNDDDHLPKRRKMAVDPVLLGLHFDPGVNRTVLQLSNPVNDFEEIEEVPNSSSADNYDYWNRVVESSRYKIETELPPNRIKNSQVGSDDFAGSR